MPCDEVGNLGKMDALLTAATLMRSWGMTLWCFWQNVAQLQIYGAGKYADRQCRRDSGFRCAQHTHGSAFRQYRRGRIC